MSGDDAQITQLLQDAPRHDQDVTEKLFPLVYNELRQMARQQMASETPGHTLQPTALVHEAYLRLASCEDLRWENRGHFFAAAARAMRQILVERARRHQAQKRGGNQNRLDEQRIDMVLEEPPAEELLALDAALEKLERIDRRKSRIVALRYFSGLTIAETARALDVAPTTVKDDWQFARAWLYKEMTRDD